MTAGKDRIVKTGAAGTPVEDEGLGGEGGERQRRAVVFCERVPRGKRGNHLLLEQRANLETKRIEDGRADEGRVDALLTQAIDQLARASFLEHQRDQRERLAETA